MPYADWHTCFWLFCHVSGSFDSVILRQMSTAQLEPRQAKTIQSPNVLTTPPQSTAPAKAHWWVWVIVVLVIGAGVAGVILLVHESRSTAQAGSSHGHSVHDVPVVTATARSGDLNLYLIGLGTVTPLNTVTVKSRVDGAIDKIAFTEGQMVKKGDLLIQIDPRPYDAALKQAEGQLARDQAAMASADWNVQQDNEAIKTNAIAQQQLHTDTATRDQATGSIEIDQAAIDTAKLNLTYARITSPIDGRIGLRLVDIGNIVHASDTTGLVVITQLQPITVVFNLPEDNIAQIQKRVASGKPVAVDAYDRNLTHKLATGKLMAIDNQINQSTGTVAIKAIFDNKDDVLFPDQFVNARMLIDTVANAVLVPTAAIQHTPTSSFVYVFKKGDPATTKPSAADTGAKPEGDAKAHGKSRGPDSGIPGTVTIRQVTEGQSQAAIGQDEEDTTAITSGLEPGEIVVTDGVDKLLEGTKVLAHPAAATTKHHAGATTAPSGATTRPVSGRRKIRPTAAE
jgi:multidrug efflux system membrane fusion protein